MTDEGEADSAGKTRGAMSEVDLEALGEDDVEWRPRRGPLFKLTAWGLILLIAAGVIGMLIEIAGSR